LSVKIIFIVLKKVKIIFILFYFILLISVMCEVGYRSVREL